MSQTPEDTLLEFPCRFPIKVMGRESESFRRVAVELVERHTGSIDEADIVETASSKGNFVSLTVTITATSREQLDDIYRDLSESEVVLVAL